MVQEQADTLEAENRKLKSAHAVTGGSLGFGSPSTKGHHARGKGGGATGEADLPFVASAALSTMDLALRHVGRELAYWRGRATRAVFAKGLRPLGGTGLGPPLLRPRVLRAPREPEATGEEKESAATVQYERLQRTMEEAGRFMARVNAARCAPKVVSLVGLGAAAGAQKPAQDSRVAQKVEAARMVSEYRRLREGVEAVFAELRPSVTGIKGAASDMGPISAGTDLPLVGRVRVKAPAGGGHGAMAEGVPVLVDDAMIRSIFSSVVA